MCLSIYLPICLSLLSKFLVKLLTIISLDILLGFLIWILYKYIDLKYFSTLDITLLKEENEYLKKENKKINGTSTNFWKEDDC